MVFGKRGSALDANRRDRARTRTDVPCQIMLPARKALACRILDLSSTGARISVPSVLGLPQRFEVLAHGRSYRAEIVRRRPGIIAVRFI